MDFILLDILSLELALYVAFLILREAYHAPLAFDKELSLFLAEINISVTFFTEGYKDILRRGFLKEMTAVCKHMTLIAMVIILLLFFLHNNQKYFRQLLFMMIPLSILLMYLTRIALKTYLKKRYLTEKHATNVMVVGSKLQAEMMLGALQVPSVSIFRVVGVAVLDQDMKGKRLRGIPVSTNGEELIQYICSEVIDEVFISYPEDAEKEMEIIEKLVEVGIAAHLFVKNQVGALSHFEVETISGMRVMTCSSKPVSTMGIFVKRILDIVGGLVGLLLAFLIGLVVAPVIYAKSPGPVLFTQLRVGKNGRFFKLYKFRSMYMDAEERKKELMAQNSMQGHMFKLENDPRIIRGIGEFIRRTSLDEFPQFYNVLKGDMSLVGTRPPTVDEFEKYELHHKKRLCMSPGITGLWQVSGRNKITDFEEVVCLDASYIDNWSLELDIKILLKTMWVVLHHTGAR